jgi:hypothetical protein
MTASAVQQLVTDAHVPGLSMAVIGDRQATALIVVGVRNSLDRAAVDQQTIFAAASLSKPLFAYAPTGRYRQARVRHTPVGAFARHADRVGAKLGSRDKIWHVLSMG